MSFEQQLRDDLKRAGAAAPIVPVSWDETLTRARRVRRLHRSLIGVAAAAVVAAALVGGSLVWEGERTLSPARPTPRPSTPPEEGVSLAEVEPTTKEWIEAIGRGDARTAWRLLSPGARANIGAYPRFAEMVSNELAEGVGAFARASQTSYATSVVVSSGEGAAGVVTVAGTVTQEGARRENWVAIPFRALAFQDNRVVIDQAFDGRWGVSPVRPALDVEGGNVFPRGGRLAADLLPASGKVAQLPTVSFHIDGDRLALKASVVREIKAPSGRAVRAAARLPRSIAPGPHLLTIVAVDSAGRMYSRALSFDVLPS
jgi:hypothetical protein